MIRPYTLCHTLQLSKIYINHSCRQHQNEQVYGWRRLQQVPLAGGFFVEAQSLDLSHDVIVLNVFFRWHCLRHRYLQMLLIFASAMHISIQRSIFYWSGNFEYLFYHPWNPFSWRPRLTEGLRYDVKKKGFRIVFWGDDTNGYHCTCAVWMWTAVCSFHGPCVYRNLRSNVRGNETNFIHLFFLLLVRRDQVQYVFIFWEYLNFM